MEKRTLKIGGYNTAAYGWTLTGLTLGDPPLKENYVEKQGGDGSWDLTTALTGGIPRYKTRPFTATLELSTGTRASRENIINELVNTVDGLEHDIITPDRPDHYLHGRLKVSVKYSNLAHAAVTITGILDPWIYSLRESVVELIGAGGTYTAHIRNTGRKAVVPMLTVAGHFLLTYKGTQVELNPGTYKWSTLLLTPGSHSLEYSGDGTLTLTYREAVLR